MDRLDGHEFWPSSQSWWWTGKPGVPLSMGLQRVGHHWATNWTEALFCWLAGLTRGIQGGASGNESTCQCRRYKRHVFNPRVRKIPWRRKWQPTQVFLPGKSHYSPWGLKALDTTEWLITSPTGLTEGFTVGSAAKNLPANAGDLGLIPGSRRSSGEEKGNQLQHSCLENLMDRGACWAIVHGVTKITPATGLIKRAHTVHPLAVQSLECAHT